MKKLQGLIAAPFTPFHEDGSVCFEAIPMMADSLVADGVRGAYICGSTGEGISCSLEERFRIMEAWADASGGRLTLIAHTGALALPDVKQLGRKALELGYHAFSVVPPTYFRPDSPDRLLEYCRIAAQTVPELPFYYYHSILSGLNFSMADFLEKADGVIPNLAGVKFNHHNLYDFQNAQHVCGGKYDVVFGVDEFFAGALALGADCFIGSTYNYSAPLYRSVWDAFRAGDWKCVSSGMKKICDGVRILNEYGGLAAGKAMMRIKGIECGPARPPVRVLTPEERSVVAGKMARILEA